MRISLGYNAVPAEAEKLILDVFRSGQYSPGEMVKEFEERFADLHKAKHGVFVNSGTDALRLALLALKEQNHWKDGSRVIVPSLTFVSTVNVILQANLKPYFVDVGMNDYLINPWNLERRLEGKVHEDIVAIIPVHLFGQACDDYVFKLARKYKLKVIEDSCETILNPIEGHVSCYSTYMAHHVTTGVGGLALTNDDTLNIFMRSYANHGRNGYYLPGYKTDWSLDTTIRARFRFDRIGYSSRATEFEAVLGLAQLSGLSDAVLNRSLVASLLMGALSGFDDLRIPMPPLDRAHTWMMFPIVLKENSKIDKYDLCLSLEKAGIETRNMMPITNQPCYRGLVDERDFPVAERVNRCGFYIPCHGGMGAAEVEHIKKAFTAKLQKKAISVI